VRIDGWMRSSSACMVSTSTAGLASGRRPSLTASRSALGLVADGLLGRSTPEAWNNEQWVRAATGRAELLEEQRSYLGLDVKRLPLLR